MFSYPPDRGESPDLITVFGIDRVVINSGLTSVAESLLLVLRTVVARASDSRVTTYTARF